MESPPNPPVVFDEPAHYGSVPLGPESRPSANLDGLGTAAGGAVSVLALTFGVLGAVLYTTGGSAAGLSLLMAATTAVGLALLTGLAKHAFAAGDAESLEIYQHEYVLVRGGVEELHLPIATLAGVEVHDEGVELHYRDAPSQVLLGATLSDEHLAWINEDIRRYQARNGTLDDVPDRIRALHSASRQRS